MTSTGSDDVDGFLRNKRFLILDGDSKFTAHFRRILNDAGVELVRTSFQAPNMNAFAERWVLSAKSECLDKMIFFGTRSLERALREFVAHYQAERPHQGLGNALIETNQTAGNGKVVSRERLGGLLKSYERSAA